MRYETVMDLHTHTIASGHASKTLREMAKAAAGRGLENYRTCTDDAGNLP